MDKHVVITGANRGIGLEFVKHYIALGCTVYAICRNSSEQLEQTGAVIITNIELTQVADINSLTDYFTNTTIDLLINNAGILRDEQLGQLNFDTIEEQFQTNTLAPLRLTQALQASLKQGSKVAMITSRMGSITDNTSGGRYGYRMSKAALNIASMSLSHDLKPQGVAVGILHPGYVATDMVGGRGDISPALSVERLTARIDELTLETSGTFWHSNGEVLPW